MPEPIKRSHPLAILAGIAGAVAGWLLGEYCGAILWIPGGALLVFLVLFTWTPIQPAFFPGAIAVTAAQVTWFIVSVSGSWTTTAVNIIVPTAGIVWLWWWPGLPAAMFLGVVEVISLALDGYKFSSVPPGSPEHRALTAYCALRVAVVFCLVVGYVRMKRELSPSIPAPMASGSEDPKQPGSGDGEA